MKTILRLNPVAMSVITTGATDHWIRRIYSAKILSLICLSAFAAFAQGVTPTSLSFTLQQNGTPPPTQSLDIFNGGSFTLSGGGIALDLGGEALPYHGTTPTSFSVSIDRKSTRLNSSHRC